MSTLEKCTDVLLQQRVIQSSHYERLEWHIRELERSQRSALYDIKQLLCDLHRRRLDMAELRDSNEQLAEQLAHNKLRFGALSLMLSQAKKRRDVLEGICDTCASTWAGVPARLLHVIRALQERKQLVKEASIMSSVLEMATHVVRCAKQAEWTRTVCVSRLEGQSVRINRLNELLADQLACAEQHAAQDELFSTSSAVRHSELLRVLHESQRCELDCLSSVCQDESYVSLMRVRNDDVREALCSSSVQTGERAQHLECLRVEHEELLLQLHEARGQLGQLRYPVFCVAHDYVKREAAARQVCDDLESDHVIVTRNIATSISRRDIAAARLQATSRAIRSACFFCLLRGMVYAYRERLRGKVLQLCKEAEVQLFSIRKQHEDTQLAQREDRRLARCRESLDALKAEEMLTRQSIYMVEGQAYTLLLTALMIPCDRVAPRVRQAKNLAVGALVCTRGNYEKHVKRESNRRRRATIGATACKSRATAAGARRIGIDEGNGLIESDLSARRTYPLAAHALISHNLHSRSSSPILQSSPVPMLPDIEMPCEITAGVPVGSRGRVITVNAVGNEIPLRVLDANQGSSSLKGMKGLGCKQRRVDLRSCCSPSPRRPHTGNHKSRATQSQLPKVRPEATMLLMPETQADPHEPMSALAIALQRTRRETLVNSTTDDFLAGSACTKRALLRTVKPSATAEPIGCSSRIIETGDDIFADIFSI